MSFNTKNTVIEEREGIKNTDYTSSPRLCALVIMVPPFDLLRRRMQPVMRSEKREIPATPRPIISPPVKVIGISPPDNLNKTILSKIIN